MDELEGMAKIQFANGHLKDFLFIGFVCDDILALRAKLPTHGLRKAQHQYRNHKTNTISFSRF